MHLPLRSSAGIWIALILGGALRFVGLGALPHPDELALLQSTARISWPELNPGWFDYPSFFLYQLAALDWLSLGDGTSLEARLLLFRAWTALLSVGGIAAAWALACRLGGPTAALFAAGMDVIHSTRRRGAPRFGIRVGWVSSICGAGGGIGFRRPQRRSWIRGVCSVEPVVSSRAGEPRSRPGTAVPVSTAD